MFSGIITTTASVVSYEQQDQTHTLALQCPEACLEGLEIGASISVSGVCLTVTGVEEQTVSFDISQETQQLTTFDSLQKGDRVNIERSIKVGDEVGGHVVSGHVHGVGELIEKKENNEYRFRLPENLKKFVIEKGFIALNGASLTAVRVDQESGEFSVAFIPETLQSTTFGDMNIGEKVNVEVDQQTRIIIETVERVMNST